MLVGKSEGKKTDMISFANLGGRIVTVGENEQMPGINEINSGGTGINPQNSNHEVPSKMLENANINQMNISVIIPTKNAGPDFENLIKTLKHQVGFAEIEIVIVDSGSQDDTIKISRKCASKVIEILPEDFSHSYARNLGAINASGDYFLFTVQDALPPSNTWLHTMMTKMVEFNASAVSCAEQPREDSDLFYKVISWHHYEYLEVNKSDRILSMPAEQNNFNLRKNGQLSNIACLISADLFYDYQFRFSYAEDLDLGLRLIKDGHKLAFLNTPRINHSHNRSPYYSLKRGYVDNLTLSDIFSDFKIPDTNLLAVSADIGFIFHFICTHIITKISEFTYPQNLTEFENSLKQLINSISYLVYPLSIDVTHCQHLDEDLSDIIEELLHFSYLEKAGKPYQGRLVNALLDFVNITFRYLKQSYKVIDVELAEEIKSCIMKEAAVLSGAELAFSYLNSSEYAREKYSSIYSSLRKDI